MLACEIRTMCLWLQSCSYARNCTTFLASPFFSYTNSFALTGDENRPVFLVVHSMLRGMQPGPATLQKVESEREESS